MWAGARGLRVLYFVSLFKKHRGREWEERKEREISIFSFECLSTYWLYLLPLWKEVARTYIFVYLSINTMKLYINVGNKATHWCIIKIYTLLFFSRRGSFTAGQLMRIHVVTPKAPVNVTLNPQVQPGPDPCPRFIPQPSSFPPIKLSALSYWVLRLPFSYVGDSGPYFPPNPFQVDVTSYGKFFKGCFGISEIMLDRWFISWSWWSD